MHFRTRHALVLGLLALVADGGGAVSTTPRIKGSGVDGWTVFDSDVFIGDPSQPLSSNTGSLLVSGETWVEGEARVDVWASVGDASQPAPAENVAFRSYVDFEATGKLTTTSGLEAQGTLFANGTSKTVGIGDGGNDAARPATLYVNGCTTLLSGMTTHGDLASEADLLIGNDMDVVGAVNANQLFLTTSLNAAEAAVGTHMYASEELHVGANRVHATAVGVSLGHVANPTGALEVNGDMCVSDTITTGAVTSSTLDIGSEARVNGATTAPDTRFVGDVHAQGDVSVDDWKTEREARLGTDLLVTKPLNGRVGIGITTPTETLDLAGDLDVSNVLDVRTDMHVMGQAQVSSTATVAENLVIHGDHVAVDTDVFYFDATTSRLGIGKTVPTVALDVDGTARAADWFSTTVDTRSVTTSTLAAENANVTNNVAAGAVTATLMNTAESVVTNSALVSSSQVFSDISLFVDAPANGLMVDTVINRIAVGVDDPQSVLHVGGSGLVSGKASTVTGNAVIDASLSAATLTAATGAELNGDLSVAGTTRIQSTTMRVWNNPPLPADEHVGLDMSSMSTVDVTIAGDTTVGPNTLAVDVGLHRVGFHMAPTSGATLDIRGNVTTTGSYLTGAGISAELPIGSIIMWTRSLEELPGNWAPITDPRCTNFASRFPMGASSNYTVNTPAGITQHTHPGSSDAALARIPPHTHSMNPHTHTVDSSGTTHGHEMRARGTAVERDFMNGSPCERGGTSRSASVTGLGTEYDGKRTFGLDNERTSNVTNGPNVTNGAGHSHTHIVGMIAEKVLPPYIAVHYLCKVE